MLSGIKQYLNLAVDLIAEKLDIIKIVPVKLSPNNGTFVKKLALKWMKINKTKNSKGNDQKFKNRVAEFLGLIRSLVDSEQFNLLPIRKVGQKIIDYFYNNLTFVRFFRFQSNFLGPKILTIFEFFGTILSFRAYFKYLF